MVNNKAKIETKTEFNITKHALLRVEIFMLAFLIILIEAKSLAGLLSVIKPCDRFF